MPYDFLAEPLVEASEGGQPRRLTLPGLLAEWASGHEVSLDGLRRHQRAGMHMFLVQAAVGGICLSGGTSELDVGEGAWRERLLAIAPAAAWSLIAEADDAPALMQPAIPAEQLRRFYEADNPDALTILVAAKNHCLKQNAIAVGSPWHWLCALVEQQTLSGYGGSRNYGVIRMNGGFGSRPLVAVYPDMRDGARWARDVARYYAALQEKVPEGFSGSATEGLVATWTRPWDGVAQIAMPDLHPAFIEVSRRVRLKIDVRGQIVALVGNSGAARIAAPKTLCGRTGDPWAPMDGPDKILTVSADGWSLRRLRNLIVGGGSYIDSLLQEITAADRGDLFFHASVVTRGEGKTEGFHEVTIPIPGRVVVSLATMLEARRTLGQASAEMSADADKAASALRRALVTFLEGGIPPKDKVERKETDAWVSRLQAAVKDKFFPMLWAALDSPGRAEWRTFLRKEAGELYEKAVLSLPTRRELFYRAHTKGKGVLVGRLNAEFADTPSTAAKEKAA